jgi:hypothetical protein
MAPSFTFQLEKIFELVNLEDILPHTVKKMTEQSQALYP